MSIVDDILNFLSGNKLKPNPPMPLPPFLQPVVPIPVPLPNISVPTGILFPPWMKVALSLKGIRETPGSGDTHEIIDWAKNIGGDVAVNYTHDSIPWCGLFMGITQKLGLEPGIKTPLWAQAWGIYGISVPPAFGAILVFLRDGGGHVSYYWDEDKDYYYILGGNQSDMVNITRTAKNRLIASRWPPGADQYYKIHSTHKDYGV